MSAKPIDEFLKECNVWLEKIAAAKAREEAALRETEAAQLEKKAFRGLARLLGKGLSRAGKGINRAGNKMQRWGKVTPKNANGLQNPLAKQVAAAHKAGAPASKFVRGTDGKYVLRQPTATTKVPAGKSAQTPAPTKNPAPAQKPVESPAPEQPAPAPANPAPAPQSVKAPAKKPSSNTGDTSKPKSNTDPAPEQPAPAPANAEVAAPTLWTKAKPWAYAGGGFIAGNLMGGGEQPQQIDPAHAHNMAVLEQMYPGQYQANV